MFRSLHIANKIPHFPHSNAPCKLPAPKPRKIACLCAFSRFVFSYISILCAICALLSIFKPV
nr:MAG TPA: hypothetical protein [Caudoviricetes sp.]